MRAMGNLEKQTHILLIGWMGLLLLLLIAFLTVNVVSAQDLLPVLFSSKDELYHSFCWVGAGLALVFLACMTLFVLWLQRVYQREYPQVQSFTLAFFWTIPFFPVIGFLVLCYVLLKLVERRERSTRVLTGLYLLFLGAGLILQVPYEWIFSCLWSDVNFPFACGVLLQELAVICFLLALILFFCVIPRIAKVVYGPWTRRLGVGTIGVFLFSLIVIHGLMNQRDRQTRLALDALSGCILDCYRESSVNLSHLERMYVDLQYNLAKHKWNEAELSAKRHEFGLMEEESRRQMCAFYANWMNQFERNSRNYLRSGGDWRALWKTKSYREPRFNSFRNPFAAPLYHQIQSDRAESARAYCEIAGYLNDPHAFGDASLAPEIPEIWKYPSYEMRSGQWFYPVLQKLHSSHWFWLARLARVRMAQLACVVEEYRLRIGVYPDTLQKLDSSLLPVDPYTGGSFGYLSGEVTIPAMAAAHRELVPGSAELPLMRDIRENGNPVQYLKGRGFLIWSCGENRQDDHGKNDDLMAPPQKGAADDLLFFVVDPDTLATCQTSAEDLLRLENLSPYRL